MMHAVREAGMRCAGSATDSTPTSSTTVQLGGELALLGELRKLLHQLAHGLKV